MMDLCHYQGEQKHIGPGPHLGGPAGEKVQQEDKFQHKVMRRERFASPSLTAESVADRLVPRTGSITYPS